jgi:hypothetical protein
MIQLYICRDTVSYKNVAMSGSKVVNQPFRIEGSSLLSLSWTTVTGHVQSNVVHPDGIRLRKAGLGLSGLVHLSSAVVTNLFLRRSGNIVQSCATRAARRAISTAVLVQQPKSA